MNLRRYKSFLETDGGFAIWSVISLAFISGIATTGILALINIAARDIDFHSSAAYTAMIFMVLVSVAVGAEAIMIKRAIIMTEEAIHQSRCRFITNIQNCELIELNKFGRGRLFAAISNNLQILSSSSWNLAISAKMFPLVIGTALYMLYLSVTAFVVMAIACFFIILFFQRTLNGGHETDKNPNEEIYNGLSDILSATREEKLNLRRANTSAKRFQETSDRVKTNASEKEQFMALKYVFSQVSFFLLIGAMIFIAPIISDNFGDTIQESTTAILFLIGPVGAIVSSIPLLQTCMKAIDDIMELQGQLETHSADRPTNKNGNNIHLFEEFENISFQNIEYTHENTEAVSNFTVGPLSFTIKVGSITFITGGNGSGKSTLLHMMTTLYPITAGSIFVDNRKINNEKRLSYRHLFSAILSDFHLGEHLDSLVESDMNELARWFRILEIDNQISLEDQKLSTTDLSSGQKKRVALAIALAEKKPILILDEWAADQDPMFRKKFYRDIVPMIKKQGTTIIAITHDDAYFDLCDHLIQLRDGQIVYDNKEV